MMRIRRTSLAVAAMAALVFMGESSFAMRVAPRVGRTGGQTAGPHVSFLSPIRTAGSSFRVSLVPTLTPTLHAAPGAPKPASLSAGRKTHSAPLRLVIAGPPGSGKTTLGKKIAEEYGLVQVSVGQLLREYAQDDEVVAEIMRRGDLVDAELVLGLVKKRLQSEDIQRRGFVLDGFPRRLQEARVFSRIFDGAAPVDAVVELDIPEEVLKRRILARGRADDTEETFTNRMEVYRRETIPAVELLKESVPSLRPALGDSDEKTSFERVKGILDRFLESLGR